MENTLQEKTLLESSKEALTKRSTETKKLAGFSETPTQLYLGSDLGGSNSRTIMLFEGRDLGEEDFILTPSSYVILDEEDKDDVSLMKSSSPNIQDNLEVIIREDALTAKSKANSWFLEETHILKGSLLDNSNAVKMDINNQHAKMNDIGIYINHLVNIAIAAYETKSLDVHVKTGVTLPVTERYSTAERISEFVSLLSGIYHVELPRLGFKVKVTINPDDIVVESEAETAYYFLISDQHDNDLIHNAMTRNIVMNDMGRTTYNMSLISEGSASSRRSRTAKFGGDNLVAKLHDLLSRNYPEAIDYAQVQRALETGVIELGATTRPIGDELTQVKKEVAKQMLREYTQFLQRSTMQATQIYLNVFLGRTMGSTGTMHQEEGGEITYSADFSPSIGQLFTEMFKKYSSSSQGYVLSDPGSATIIGLALALANDWGLTEQ